MVSLSEKWLCSLIGGLDKNVDDETLKRVLVDCGRGLTTAARDLDRVGQVLI